MAVESKRLPFRVKCLFVGMVRSFKRKVRCFKLQISRFIALGHTPGQAKLRISKLRKDPKFLKLYLDPTAPGHEEAVKRLQYYYNIAYQEEPKEASLEP